MPSVRFKLMSLALMLPGLLLSANNLLGQYSVAALIDQLPEIESPDTGYAQNFAGHNFLPYEDTEELGMMILGATQRERSKVMRQIVEAGVEAVPELLKHLGDERKAKLPRIDLSSTMWLAFEDEYDFNRATTKVEPQGVNVDSFPNFEHAEKHPSSHEITVGDLCFVALGQIVNRRWSACRYQPTGGQVISSPTYSKTLRDAILNEWGKLDRESHKQRLIEDFQQPDFEGRIIGAYLRLCLYYPEEVEKLVLELLRRPIPDAHKTHMLVDQIISAKDAGTRKRELDEILGIHGQHYRQGLQEYFFMKIINADIREKNGYQLNSEELTAREILRDAFDWPKDVKYADFLKIPKTALDSNEIARVIKALTHDDSQAVGDAVKGTLELDRFKNDSYMQQACLTCLASRQSFGSYLADKLERIDFKTATSKEIGSSSLEAIANSKSPEVRDQLKRIAATSNDPYLFLVAAKAIENPVDVNLVQRAKAILNRLPADTRDGMDLLSWLVEKAPDEAESVLIEFLKPNTPTRCNTVCEVLWYGNPLSQRVLPPLLDDKRSIPKVTVRVRDRAAQALSHSIKTIKYDSDWSESEREKAIQKMKEFCQRK